MGEVDRLKAELDRLIEEYPTEDDVSPIYCENGRWMVRRDEGGYRVFDTKAEAVRYAVGLDDQAELRGQ